MKKKYNYLFVFLLLMFSFSIDANALKFITKGKGYENKYVYHDNNLNFYNKNVTGNYFPSTYKQYTKDDKNYYFAYCADPAINFGEGEHTLDTKYGESKKCKYLVNGTTKYGDCSEMVGYVIQKSYEKAVYEQKNNPNSKCASDIDLCKYGYAQGAVWAYLAAYVDADAHFKVNNISDAPDFVNAPKNNPEIKKIIEDAGAKYNEDINNGLVNEQEQVDNNLYTISGDGATNNKFYYVPNSNQCGSIGGTYETKPIVITNNKDKTINLTITPQNTGYEVVYEDAKGNKITTTKDKYTIELGPREAVQIHLQTAKFIGAENAVRATANINIYGELAEKETKTSTYTVYNSERWTRAGSQSMLILTTDSRNSKTNIKYTKTTNLSYIQERLEFKKPSESNTDSGQGRCANITTNINEIITDLKASNCKTVDLGNGSYVKVIITENVKFTYGYLYPSKYTDKTKVPKVFSGGGFNLNTDTSLGVVTKYQVAIKWQYADYNLATGNPYFYNNEDNSKSNPNDYPAIKEKINQVLFEGIEEKYQGLTLEIDTYDSNKINEDGTGIDYEYEFNIYENAKEKSTISGFNSNNELNLNISKIELNMYKMTDKKNGDISYCNDKKTVCENDGYLHRAYFVPMHYSGDGDTFKFNIKEKDVSLVNEIELMYEGTCNIKTENRFNGPSNDEENKGKGLRYRSITVSDPFPKANSSTGEGIPANWKDWYMQEVNKNRIKNTFERGIIYHLDITTTEQQKIDEFNKNSYYTDWDNMEKNGSSKFVRELFGPGKTESYCELGIFKEECDK